MKIVIILEIEVAQTYESYLRGNQRWCRGRRLRWASREKGNRVSTTFVGIITFNCGGGFIVIKEGSL